MCAASCLLGLAVDVGGDGLVADVVTIVGVRDAQRVSELAFGIAGRFRFYGVALCGDVQHDVGVGHRYSVQRGHGSAYVQRVAHSRLCRVALKGDLEGGQLVFHHFDVLE